MRRLHRSRPERNVGVAADRFAAPRATHGRETVGKDLAFLGTHDVERVEQRRLIAAAHTENHAAVRQLIEHGNLFGGLQWMAQRQQIRRGTEPDRSRCTGDRGEQHHRFWNRTFAEMVFGQPERLVSPLLRQLRLARQLIGPATDRREPGSEAEMQRIRHGRDVTTRLPLQLPLAIEAARCNLPDV